MVKKEFVKVQERLQKERNMKIIQEGVIPEFARNNSASLSGNHSNHIIPQFRNIRYYPFNKIAIYRVLYTIRY